MADGDCDTNVIQLEIKNSQLNDEGDNDIDNAASEIECKKKTSLDEDLANCSVDEYRAKLKACDESKCDFVPFKSLIQEKDNNKFIIVCLHAPGLKVKKQFVCCGKDCAPNFEVPPPNYTPRSFDVRVLTGPGVEDYRATKQTPGEIIPTQCYHEVQTEWVKLYLAKKEPTPWSGQYDDCPPTV